MLFARSGKRFDRFCSDIIRFPAENWPEVGSKVVADDVLEDLSATG
jgi:hypothetical protein